MTLVDTRQVGMGTGYAVLAAADAVDEGADATAAGAAARARAEATTSLFYVDTLEYLRRGGRMGAAAALIGSALAVKPILRVDQGRIGSFEKVRTSAKALSRLEELRGRGGRRLRGRGRRRPSRQPGPCRAAGRTPRLPAGGALGEREVSLGEIGAVLGAHVGPGMVAVAVARRS